MTKKDDDNSPPPASIGTGRWRRIEDGWRNAGLGEEPPEWLEEYVTQTELTLADLHGPRDTAAANDAWAILRQAFDSAKAPPPADELRPFASAIVAAVLRLGGR
jgi:hypothetical protein